jgi:hypothetical protein
VPTVPKPANAATTEAKLPAQTQWGALSQLKIAKIQLCDKKGAPIASAVVSAILVDGDLSVESQYQSPFESSNPEGRLPVLLGMAQSGEATAALGRIAENIGNSANATGPEQAAGFAAQAARAFSEATGADVLGRAIGAAIESLEGRTNLTKVNSTQVFVSTAPVRLSITLFFMAYKDAAVEVESQIRQLQKWALPIELSGAGLVESVVTEGLAGLFPSTAPPFVSLVYGGKTYKPFLIESVSAPITAPIDKDGNRLSLTVSMSLVSRQAWDQNNINPTLYGA